MKSKGQKNKAMTALLLWVKLVPLSHTHGKKTLLDKLFPSWSGGVQKPVLSLLELRQAQGVDLAVCRVLLPDLA